MLLDLRKLPDSSPATRLPAAAPAPAAPEDERSEGGGGGGGDVEPEADLYGWHPTWAAAVMRWRWTLVPLWLLANALAFNGQWRIGLDSALYRHLGHNLATGEGYRIFGELHGHVYPGLPLLLAGLEKLFGPEAAWPGVIVMLLMSAAAVAFTYLLARRVLPAWGATIVTAGVAFNFRFVQQGHELMTDAPFLLGVVMALWGWEAVRNGPRWRGASAFAVGLLLAASMRPTFWVLAGALMVWGGVATVRGLASRDPSHRRHAIYGAAGLAAVLVVGLIFVALDPRTRGLDLAGGGYEAEVVDRLHRLGPLMARMPEKLFNVIDNDVARLFFAERVEVLNVLFTLAMLGGVGLLAVRGDRPDARRPLWVLLVGVLFVAVLLASSEPRYWLMVLPVFWAGWLAGLMKGARDWFSSPRARSIYVAVGVGVVLACNLGHVGKLIVEQRATPFLETYKEGDYVPVLALAEALREGTEPDAVIIGPYAPLLSYESNRRILDRRVLDFDKISDEVGRLVQVRDSGATWMVFPHQPYEHKDRELYRLVKDGKIYPSNLRPEDVIYAGTFGKKGAAVEWYVAPFEVDELLMPEELRVRLRGLESHDSAGQSSPAAESEE